jgi:transcriptional regulator with XRE-family HTH domain
MQAQSISLFHLPYAPVMKTGRPAKSERSDFGARLHELREAAGLTQQQVAEQLGISQPSYALWERSNVALRPEQLTALAKILGVTTDALLVGDERKNRGGPVGKARRVFEEVSKLPRGKQDHIVKVVSALIAQAKAEAA